MSKPNGRVWSFATTALLSLSLPQILLADPSGALPRVGSINVCADQLVLGLADPEQIVTLSWLASDPEESMLADAAAAFAPNYGSAEELLRYDPDVVIAGAYTGAYTRALLERLGYAVVDVPLANDLDGIASNVRLVAAAIGQVARGEAAVMALYATAERSGRRAPAPPVGAIVLRPGGFTVEAGSLADRMMTLAGLRNIAAESGLDRWGSLSVETLLRTSPELLILPSYRDGDASLAHAALQHPAVLRMRADTPTATVPSAAWSCGLPESLATLAILQQAAHQVRAPLVTDRAPENDGRMRAVDRGVHAPGR